jgi:hypothetical protein
MEKRSLLHFSDSYLHIIEEAIDFAQEVVTDYFKMSTSEWKGYRYEVKTQKFLDDIEITDRAFAQICKYECIKGKNSSPPLSFDLYRICLQDKNILRAVHNPLNKVKLKPLLLYIITHELSHVIRFSKYYKDFFAPPWEKESEEAKVHSITYEMLRSKGDQSLDYVLDYYRLHRWNDKYFTL